MEVQRLLVVNHSKFIASRVVYLMKYRIVTVLAWRQNEVDLVEKKVRYFFTFKFANLTWLENDNSFSPDSISPLIGLMTQLAG